jgi:hypothetical protein
MNIQNQDNQQVLQDIKSMMERSSRFISLSGLSGVAAGCCALIGAYFASNVIGNAQLNKAHRFEDEVNYTGFKLQNYMGNKLFIIALVTFITSLLFSFLFTWIRSKKTNTPLWGNTAKRLLINVAVPMIAGGIYILKLMESGAFGLIAPGCLIFYGLALVNASKYTLTEIRFLGYFQILLGIINLWALGYGIYFWAIGFGVLHIVYGAIMWFKYERD